MNNQIALLPSRNSKSQQQFFAKVAIGLKREGVEVVDNVDGEIVPKTVACWGWRTGRGLRQRGHNVLVFERGYIGDRFYWTSIAWNGLNGHGDFCLGNDYHAFRGRFQRHFPIRLKPWKNDGQNIIIMGQVNGDASLDGKNLTPFYERLAAQLENEYPEHGVSFRPHPLAARRGIPFRPNGIKHSQGELSEVLSNAFLVASWNSNSLVDSVLSGVPSLSFDEGSMAWEMTGHDASARVTPLGRDLWAERLSHCQWSPQEIESGAYWEQMSKGYDPGVLLFPHSPIAKAGQSFITMLSNRQ